MPKSPNLLVTGASGHLGRRIVELLLEAKAGPLIATTRDPAKLADLKGRGVDVRQADFDAPGGLKKAFKGADRLLLISTDAVDKPGRRQAQHEAAIAAAEAAGVRHVVYTSAPSARPAPGRSIVADHFWTEVALIRSKLTWTILRHNLYAELLLMSLPQAAKFGQLLTAAGTGGRSYVTREDCARADAAALASASTDRLIHDISGPAALTPDDLAALASEFSGKPVKTVKLEPEAYRQALTGAGVPAISADILVEFDTEARRGYHAMLSPAVAELTGQAPLAVRDFLLKNKAAFAG